MRLSLSLWIPACVLCTLLSAPAGEHVYDTFESHPVSALNSIPGWESSGGTVIINPDGAWGSSREVKIPETVHAIGTTSAIFTNLAVVRTEEALPVVRCAFALFRETTNGSGTVTLETPAGIKLLLATDQGRLHFDGVDTGIPHATGRYVSVAMYYDMDRDLAALDYDNVRIVDWTPVSGVAATNLTRFTANLAYNAAANEGPLRLDNLVIETLPADTLAWWRYTETRGDFTADHAGRFQPAQIIGYNNEWIGSFTDPVYVEGDYHNPGAMVSPNILPITNGFGTAVFTNWTVEALLRITPGGGNVQIIDWMDDQGILSTNTAIGVFWSSPSNIAANLRDGEQTSNSKQYIPSAGYCPADGQWHHVALIKTGAVLIGYLDYEPVRTNLLASSTRGEYRMDQGNQANVGGTLNGGNTSNDSHIFDEVRITGRYLDQSEFINPGQPFFLEPQVWGGSTWTSRIVTIPGSINRLEAATDAQTADWHAITTITAQHAVVDVPIPPPNPFDTRGTLRVRRDWMP